MWWARQKILGFQQLKPQRYPNNTYMMRLAEMYLIYAEAALGNSASTTDATGFKYFNASTYKGRFTTLADPYTALHSAYIG